MINKRSVPEINGGSMADIAFLLLIFFLVATTMDVDSGISRLLPPMPEEDQQDDDSEIKERNVFVVLINRDDQLFVERSVVGIEELKDLTKEFGTNDIAVIISQNSNQEINSSFKRILKQKYAERWNFIRGHWESILPIDLQFFFNKNIEPSIIY